MVLIMKLGLIFILLAFTFAKATFLVEKEEDAKKIEPTQTANSTNQEKDKLHQEEDRSFVPSLSETVSDSNRLKSEIKRELAKDLEDKPSQLTEPSEWSERAHFGDFEVDISGREEEEELKEVQ